jgi:hypothetical protein
LCHPRRAQPTTAGKQTFQGVCPHVDGGGIFRLDGAAKRLKQGRRVFQQVTDYFREKTSVPA